MRIIGLVFAIGFLISCNNNKDSKKFELIDASINNGGNLNCIKIDKYGKVNIYSCRRFDKRKRNYDLVLKENQIDSISKMVWSMISSKLDSLYECPSDHDGADIIIIKTKNRKFKFSVSGSCYKVKDVKYIYNLTRYLNELARKSNRTLDSIFVFESYSKYLFPPPPPTPLGKFQDEPIVNLMAP